MSDDADRASRKGQEGTAVSSGESSAAIPKPALDLDGMTMAGFPDPDVTQVGAPRLPEGARQVSPPPAPKTDSSNDATIAEGRRRRESSSGVQGQIFAAIGATVLEVGTVLGSRYEIQKLLGMGGMGAVYKAHDLEVDRTVGLKVIRPDLSGNPAILARFKQELVLARQVTHRNIIRIYDLNEADGVKFITMEFIEGEDLRSILTRSGKVTPKEAISIMRQACTGLLAAHQEGVIHRDLKPGNIMQDASGRVVIMDFGLAKTIQGDGMTQTGMMIGTMEYMSPEQAMGSELDARSDIFTMGLIFYELLTGNIPFRAESAIASLVKRTQERAVPLSDVDPTIPPALSMIAAKCLERDRNARYNNIQEVIDDLDTFEGRRPRSSGTQPSLRATVFTGQPVTSESLAGARALPPPAKKFPVKWVGIGAVALALAVGAGVYVKSRVIGAGGGTEATRAAALSLAIVPFFNNSADPSLNWLASSLSETLSTDIGQSQHVRLVSPGRLQQVLRDLHISPQSKLDLSALKRIAEFTNADTIVYGQYSKLGDQIRINATVYDLKHDRNFELKTDVPSEKELLGGLDDLASQVRANLSSDPDIVSELKGQPQFVLTKSMPALRSYDEGLQLSRSGKDQDAAKKFEEAVTEDPNFALAYSRLALTYHGLGFDDKADVASRRAMTLSDNLPSQEKYLVEANNAVVMNDTAKAITAYENLTKVHPDDTDAQLALAEIYEKQAHNYEEARKRLARVRAADSKNVDALLASGRVEISSGNPQAGLEFLNSAYGLATQFDNEEAKASIEHSMGIAYSDLNKLDEALKNFQDALAIRKKLGLQRGIASTLNEIAYLQDSMGHPEAAQASYKESLAAYQSIGDKHGTAMVLMNLGSSDTDHAKYEEALKLTNDALAVYRDLGDEAKQAICLNNIGTIRYYMGQFQDSLAYHQQAYQIREKLKLTSDMAESLHNLAEMNVKLGQYDTAMNQYLKALEIRRASNDQDAVAVNSSGVGALYAEQGKYGPALSALQESLKDFQQANDESWLMVEAKARYGNVLSEVGRWDEGRTNIEDAVKLATQVKNDTVLSQALNYLGDSYFYQGEYGDAKQQYDRALQVANKAHNREQTVLTRFNLARLDVVQNRSAAAIPVLKKLIDETETVGLKALSAQSSVYLAEALLATGKVQDAQQELDRALNRSEKLGLLVEQARAHYLLGEIYSRTGRTKEYAPQYQEAVRILESISKQSNAGRLLDRSDLKGIYRDAVKSYQGGA
jgi:eukaryotic-like serine/threonine-protein kinase